MYEFDLKTFLKTLRKRRKLFIINCLVAMIVGAVIAWSIPKVYTSSASLAPEMQDENALGGGMSSLASMAGINLGGGTDAIGPDLYPDVVASNSFVVDLLYVNVETVEGKKTDFITYLSEDCASPWWSVVSDAIGGVIKLITPQAPFTGGATEDGRINPQRMSREESQLVELVKSSIGCAVDDQTMVINLSASAQDPLVAKIMVDTVMTHLQNFITQYRTNKARNDLEYYQTLEREASEKYQETQRAYADYCDTHKGTILQAYISEQERLENEMSIALNTYTQVKQQVAMAEAKVQEKTPAFTVIEKSTVPNRHSSPKKMLIVFALMFVTFVGTALWIYLRLLFPGLSLGIKRKKAPLQMVEEQ